MLQRVLTSLNPANHAIALIRAFFLTPGLFFFLVGYANVWIQTPDPDHTAYISAYVESVARHEGHAQLTVSYAVEGKTRESAIPAALAHEFASAQPGEYLPVMVSLANPAQITVESHRSLTRSQYLVLLGALMIIVGVLPRSCLVTLIEEA